MNKQTYTSRKPKKNLIGLVKWFDSDKGFGVIGTPDKGEFFLHVNSFLNIPQNISKGTSIIFTKRNDQQKNRNAAENCRLVGELADWGTLLYYLEKPDIISIEVDARGRGMNGKPFHRKENQTFSLMYLSAEQFCINKSEVEIRNIVIDYFDNDLDSNHFVAYCEFVEKVLTKYFSKEISTNVINDVFSHFGKNLDESILFQVWKKKKFKFISYTEFDEYEIPETVLKTHISEISIHELRRIVNFSFGTTFCSIFIKEQFSNIKNLSSIELKNLYQFLEFENEDEREKLKSQLNNLYVQQITTELIEQATNFYTIKNNDDFNNYNKLLNLIPEELEEAEKNNIKNNFNEIAISKYSEDFLPELWLKGITEKISFESISIFFLAKGTENSNRILVLSKINLHQQFELLKIYSIENSFEEAFALIEGLAKKENTLDYYFHLSEVLFDTDFWKDKKCKELVDLFINYIDAECSNEQKYELFFKGFVKDIPQEIAFLNLHELDKEKCIKIFKSQPENKAFIKEILERKITDKNVYSLCWLYELAQDFLDDEDFNSFDKKVFESIKQSEYFKLWENNKAKILPQNHIEGLLADDFTQYYEIGKWIKDNAITQEEIVEFLFSCLDQQISVASRGVFYKQFNHIKYLLQINELYLERIKQFQNDFYNVILWFLDKEENLDFELLKGKFIYFVPDEQIRIIRKLFFLKASGKLDLTIEKLNELTRFDLDLYKTNLDFNPEIPVDVSTDVIIQALMSYKGKRQFLVESDLLSIVLKDLKRDRTRRFNLAHYFEDCSGRGVYEFDWKTNGEIKKVPFGENQFYYAITIPVGDVKRIYDRRGGYDSFIKNPYFYEHKEAVKLLPGRKWNEEHKHWEVPAQYEKEVLEFAKEHRFFLDFEGSNYANNTHLAKFKRDKKPNGVSFCEGRLANKPHEILKKDFWWCTGESCFSKCETIHSTEEWEKYTLLDFCEILSFNTDETNKRGEFISKGHYYQFVSLINRFNRLLDKLYCRDCNHILYPVKIGAFAAHAVVLFHCTNESCSNNDEIYLNHCLNGKCNNIIDSRDSKRCDNGLLICDSCGSCCSHNMLTRRLTNLESTGGYIHDNLRKCVNKKLGHLERGEYFCHKCKTKMTESSHDVFYCSNCDVKYDTTKYKIKRPHKHLVQIVTKNNDNDSNFPPGLIIDDELLF